MKSTKYIKEQKYTNKEQTMKNLSWKVLLKCKIKEENSPFKGREGGKMYQAFSEGLQIVKCLKDIESRSVLCCTIFFLVVICFEIFRCLFHP